MTNKKYPPQTAADYEVGYKKPPVATRFIKGQSGNPRGRPKDKRNLATMLNNVLNETVVVTEKGKRKTITKLEATFKQVVNRAATGEITSTKLLIQLLPLLERYPGEPGSKAINNELDTQILQLLQQRLYVNASQPQEEDADAGGHTA